MIKKPDSSTFSPFTLILQAKGKRTEHAKIDWSHVDQNALNRFTHCIKK